MKLPPEVINEFEIKVRGVVDGVLTGKFRSRSFGGSPEFAEHRAYNLGDDVRRIDWKVYARKRKLFLKLFFHDSETPTLILYDNSRSMLYQGRKEMASLLSGAFAYMAYRGNNACSLYTFSGSYLPFGRGYDQVLKIYSETLKEDGKRASFKESVLGLLSLMRKRILVVVISDFAYPTDDIVWGLKLLTKHYEVVAIQIVAPGEWNFKDDGKVLVDMETGERLNVPPNSKDVQRSKVRAWVSSVRRATVQSGGRYSLVFSDEDFGRALRRVVEDVF